MALGQAQTQFRFEIYRLHAAGRSQRAPQGRAGHNIVPSPQHPSRCCTCLVNPRGIQYAAASEVELRRRGILDHPPSRMMTLFLGRPDWIDMPRYKLIIEYDGTPFCGWQIQDNGASVQGALEDAVKAICGEQVRVHGAGRTDAGVHALGQVAHCDIARHFVPGRFRDGLNAHLRPHPIGVLSAEIVPDTFEARFSAKKRHYHYRISNRRANLALDIGRTWRLPRHLDTDAMHTAAQRLIGKHDFTTFRDTECQAKSPEKTLDLLDVIRNGDAVEILTSARSFLHSQVRSMVGSLVWVGEGRWSADDLAAALAARSRTACGPVAPPDGLYLMRVED